MIILKYMKFPKPYEIRRLKPGDNRSYCCFPILRLGDFMWHYHEYYEIFAVTRGSGSWRIGDSHGCFSSNELYLIGPGIPHAFYHGPDETGTEKIEMAVVMFQLNNGLFPELEDLSGLLEGPHHGLIFRAPGSETFDRIKDLQKFDGITGMASLLLLLSGLNAGKREEVVVLKDDYRLSTRKSDRLDGIFSYLHTNFYRDIKLGKVAAHANMSVPGLCSFFKRMTKTPVIVYVHQLRISLACRLLLDSDLAVSSIAFRCGYTSLSSFNRMFKSLRKCSPREFRQMSR